MKNLNLQNNKKAINKGFSLVELLVVVAIIGVLAAVGTTTYSGYTASAKKLGMSDEEHSEFLRIVALAAKTNQLVNGLQVPVDEIFNADK